MDLRLAVVWSWHWPVTYALLRSTQKWALPEVTLSLIPGLRGYSKELTKIVGKGKAIEMITTGDMITAFQAEKIGLVNYVVAAAELIQKAEEILNKIRQRHPLPSPEP